ncbi:hypothetical protein GmRootV118_49040 [Variovorax sp. V118]
MSVSSGKLIGGLALVAVAAAAAAVIFFLGIFATVPIATGYRGGSATFPWWVGFGWAICGLFGFGGLVLLANSLAADESPPTSRADSDSA